VPIRDCAGATGAFQLERAEPESVDLLRFRDSRHGVIRARSGSANGPDGVIVVAAVVDREDAKRPPRTGHRWVAVQLDKRVDVIVREASENSRFVSKTLAIRSLSRTPHRGERVAIRFDGRRTAGYETQTGVTLKKIQTWT
jgi:hypothetical protein